MIGVGLVSITAALTYAVNASPLGEGTLFAVTSRDSCAHDLPYGSDAIWDGATPYFCTNCVAGPHDAWDQVFMADGVHERIRIRWQFADEKSLEDRFNSAITKGENVSWTVTRMGQTHIINGTWRWSSVTGKFKHGAGPYFSVGSGLWVAAPRTVDADDANTKSGWWGQGGAVGSDDDDCNLLYEDGKGVFHYNLKSNIYAINANPSVPVRKKNGSKATPARNLRGRHSKSANAKGKR